MQSIIEIWNKFPKYKQPSWKSFDNVKKTVTDPLSEAKISCFSFICSLVEPYLKKCQADKPKVPFIYTELKSLLRNLLQLFVKPDVLNKVRLVCKLEIDLQTDLDLEENILPLSDSELDFGVKAIITKAKRKETVTNQGVAKFKREGQRFVTSAVKKLFEKRPIKCDFVRFCSIFDPAVILSCETKVLLKRFKSYF